MKKILFLVVAIIAHLSMTTAQQKQASVSISFPQHRVEYFARPNAADATTLPLIQATANNGDVFGIAFRGVAGTTPFIELLDVNAKVIKAITVNDFLGTSSAKGTKLISSTVASSGNSAENTYEVTSSQGKYFLVATSIATSGTSTKQAPAKLLFRIALRNSPSTISGARIALPFDGNAETQADGFIIMGRKSAQPLFSTIYPKPEKLSVENKAVSFLTRPLKTNDETLLLSLIIDCANTKDEASAILQSSDQKKESNIAIVNTSNRAMAQPSDTVTYQILCFNIGNASVRDVVITNPVPAGAQYLEGSAVGDETQITFERSASSAPQLGEVTIVKWKLSKNLTVGEEKIVSFKVVVR